MKRSGSIATAFGMVFALLVGSACTRTHSKPAAASRPTVPSTSAPTTRATTDPSAVTTSWTIAPSTTTTSVATSVGSAGSDARSVAERYVRSRGFTPIDSDDYEYPGPNGLHVIIAVVTGSVTGSAAQAFFFVHGRGIGTDLADTSATIQMAWRTEDTVALSYAIYRPDDANCCPLGGAATVRYQWTGTRLVPLDPIPSRDARR
jgi:hypothetical protein